MIPGSTTYQYNQVLYSNNNNNSTKASVTDGSYYFSLQTDGTFVVHGSDPDQAEWTVAPNYKMHLTEQCLQEHDCPYLHLHAGGVLVVNYLDKQAKWQQKNILHVYSF